MEKADASKNDGFTKIIWPLTHQILHGDLTLLNTQIQAQNISFCMGKRQILSIKNWDLIRFSPTKMVDLSYSLRI